MTIGKSVTYSLFTIFILNTLQSAENTETFLQLSLILLSAMLNRALLRTYYVGEKMPERVHLIAIPLQRRSVTPAHRHCA